MKRLLLLAAALTASFGFTATAVQADDSSAAVETDPSLLSYTASTTNDLLSLIPGLSGPDTRHMCFIFGQLDKSYCIYIPLP